MKLPWIVTIWPTCGAKSSDPVNQIVLWCLPSNMYLPFLDLRQPLIILSPLFAALAIEPGCESCCIEGAECSREAGGACCVPCAIDASRSERMPSSAPDEFLGALEQPTRLPSASPTTNDHSLSLLTGSLSLARNHTNVPEQTPCSGCDLYSLS